MENQRSYPGFLNAVLLLLLTLALFFVLSVALAAVMGDAAKNLSYFSSVINTVSIGLVIFIGFRKTGRSFNEVFPIAPVSFSLLFSFFFVCIGLTIVFSEMDNIFRYFLPMPGYLFNLFSDLYRGGDFTGSFILLGIVAPLTEEALFRGVVLHGFLGNYRPAKAVVLSAFLFGIVHMNPWQFVTTFLIGLFLGWLYCRTANLANCIVIHGVYNLIPLFIMRCTSIEIKGYSAFTPTVSFQPPWFDALGVLVLAAGLYAVARITRGRRGALQGGPSPEGR